MRASAQPANQLLINNGVYEQQRNRIEADQVIDAILKQLHDSPHESLGVVAFNLKQAELIEDLLSQRLKHNVLARQNIDALEAMRERLRVPVYSAGEPHFMDIKIHTDKVLRAGDEFKVGTHILRVYETPGHCIDQLAFEVVGTPLTPMMIVGDAIFAGGPGRTQNAADFKILLKTLQNVVLTWPDETLCYPGHGPHFCLGDKRAAIAAFVARDHGEFFGDAEW